MTGRTVNIAGDEYGYKNKTKFMETNRCTCKSWVKRWKFGSMVCSESAVGGSFIQKIWWWISRKEVKLKFVVEMDETELDNLFREAVGWDASVFTGESLESLEPKPKKRNKQSKGSGKSEGKAVREPAKKDSTNRKKV